MYVKQAKPPVYMYVIIITIGTYMYMSIRLRAVVVVIQSMKQSSSSEPSTQSSMVSHSIQNGTQPRPSMQRNDDG